MVSQGVARRHEFRLDLEPVIPCSASDSGIPATRSAPIDMKSRRPPAKRYDPVRDLDLDNTAPSSPCGSRTDDPILRPVNWRGPSDSELEGERLEQRRREEQREEKWAHLGALEARPSSPRVPTSPSLSSASSNGKIRASKDNGLFRRTSQTCRSKFQKAIRTRRSSIGEDEMEGLEHQGFEETYVALNASPVMAMGPPYPNKRLNKPLFDRLLNKGARQDTPQPVHGGAATDTLQPVAPSSRRYMDSPHMPQPPFIASAHLPRGGAAARQAAASSNAFRSHTVAQPIMPSYRDTRESNRLRLGSISKAADSGADLGVCGGDVEMLDAAPTTKLDPADLPVELFTAILSNLDAASLTACQQIGPWRALASDPVVWGKEYLSVFDRQAHHTSPTPAPIQIGGCGIGRPNDSRQDWERMYRAREQIEANWAAGRGKAIYMAGHTDSVYCVQFDEHKIITGSRDRTIRVWDINTFRCLKVIGGPNVKPVGGPRVLRAVDYPFFHHAEASVNGSTYGNSIYHTPRDYHSASILCLQYDDEILVTGSSDSDLIVWDVNTYEPIKRLRQHTGGVLDVAFDADHIVSCSKDCTIVVWDRKTLKPLRSLLGHNGPVNAVQLRGNLLVSASGDGVARLWDLTKMECVRSFPAKERGLAAVEFSDDAQYVLAGGNDHVTYKFSVATGLEVLQYAGHEQLVRSLFLDTANRRVVSGSYDQGLRVYDYDSGRLAAVFPEWTTSWMLAAKCDYRRIVSTSQDGRILVIDFGLEMPDGDAIPGVDLLRGCEPRPWVDSSVPYPSTTERLPMSSG